jgi:hypothetical protein
VRTSRRSPSSPAPRPVVLDDEIYGRILYDGEEHVSIASLPGMAERTIVLDGFSKTFAMTGWRLGYAIVPPSLVAMYGQLVINTISCAPTFAQVGAVEALPGRRTMSRRWSSSSGPGATSSSTGLNAIPGIRCALPLGAFYAFPSIGGTGCPAQELADRCSRGRRVRPRRDGLRRGRDRPHPDLVRELAREPDRGARPDRAVRRRARSVADGGRPRVFVSRGSSRTRARADPRRVRLDVWEDDLPPPRDELLRRVAGCDGVADPPDRSVDDEFLDAAGPQLQVVSNYAVGFDNIDVAACARRGVPVGNTPGVLTETTADLAWACSWPPLARCPRATATSATALEDVGPAAALGPGRPRRDDRDRRLRADRPGASRGGRRASG